MTQFSHKFDPGDVVWFVYLHSDEFKIDLGTARKLEEKPHKPQHYIYEAWGRIEGKARPALITKGPVKETNGDWYQVYFFTTQNKNKQHTVIPVGNAIDDSQKSYIFARPEYYPKDLISTEEGHKPLKKKLDRLAFDNITKIVGHRSLKQEQADMKKQP